MFGKWLSKHDFAYSRRSDSELLREVRVCKKQGEIGGNRLHTTFRGICICNGMIRAVFI